MNDKITSTLKAHNTIGFFRGMLAGFAAWRFNEHDATVGWMLFTVGALLMLW